MYWLLKQNLVEAPRIPPIVPVTRIDNVSPTLLTFTRLCGACMLHRQKYDDSLNGRFLGPVRFPLISCISPPQAGNFFR